jgi:hypothetical protein
MRTRLLPLCSTIAACWLLAGTLSAEDQSSDQKKAWYKTVTFNAFMSSSYSYNFNKPDTHLNAFRVFDYKNNEPKVDEAELVIQKAVSQPGDWGFRADLTAGQSIPKIAASNGLFRNSETGQAEAFDIHQMFASYIVPVGNGLRLDAGKLLTHMGYEVIEGYDGWNDNATRSFLFGYAIPFTHTGLCLSYPFSGKFTARFHVFSGWDDFRDNNSSKSVGLQLAFAPTSSLSFNVNAIYGPEQKDNSQDARQVWELTGAWKATSRTTLGINYLYGHERHALGPGLDGNWTGVAGYLRRNMTERLSVNLRAEFFDDRDGSRTGVAQRLKEVTFTPEFRVMKHVILRGDLRCDFSSADVFSKQALNIDHQWTALANLIFVY